MDGRWLPLFSQRNEKRSDCALALYVDTDLMPTFWNSFSSLSPDSDFPCLPYSLLPRLCKLNSKVLAKDRCSQPKQSPLRLLSHRVAQQTTSLSRARCHSAALWLGYNLGMMRGKWALFSC